MAEYRRQEPPAHLVINKWHRKFIGKTNPTKTNVIVIRKGKFREEFESTKAAAEFLECAQNTITDAIVRNYKIFGFVITRNYEEEAC